MHLQNSSIKNPQTIRQILNFFSDLVSRLLHITLFRWRTGEKGHSFFWDHGLHVAPWTQLHTCVGSNPDKRAPLMGLVLELSHSDAVRKRWPDSSLYRSVNVKQWTSGLSYMSFCSQLDFFNSDREWAQTTRWRILFTLFDTLLSPL